MEYNKLATTVEQQIERLLERGLISPDRDKLEKYLSSIGYYRLSAYWLPYEEVPTNRKTRSRKFKPDTTFEKILDVYIFDRQLKLLAMEAIERIEIHVRSRWTNRFTLEHGPHGFMDDKNFSCSWKHNEMLHKLATRVSRSNEVFHQHYKTRYKQPYLPPLWAICQTMSFTELSTWYARTASNSIKHDVALDLGLPTKEVMEGTLEALCYIRNICAHHGRLWNRRLVKYVPMIKKFRADLSLTSSENEATNHIYNVLVVILHMLSKQSDTTTFPARLKRHLETSADHERGLMGFPTDWRTRPIWSSITG